MFTFRSSSIVAFCLMLTIGFLANSVLAQDKAADSRIDFGRDIRPILSDTCFKCHGPDEHDRKADLRLDTKAGLFDDSGAVAPNDLDASELFQRIVSDDPDLLMPPPESGRKLTDSQKELFKRWIEQGAVWESHWSLISPTKPAIPKVNAGKVINPIDNFVIERLKAEGFTPSKSADRPTLIRRVSFDLTGLPPSTDLVRKYVESKDENWYELLVDELLESHHYGEHMARFWLDAARYGDTHGLHLDNYREMWPYRDWVVKSFIDNKSYRDFTIEQLAGDLLENPSQEQLIASGFNRAHITTNEGGAIIEEVYVRNVVDRVSTTGTVFMGMTVGCAQCHDHKFDPISQKEFYQLFAFFNNLTDAPMDKNTKDPAPVLKVLTDDQRGKLAELKLASETAQQEFDKLIAAYEYVDPADSEEETLEEKKTFDEPVEFVWVEDETLPVGAKKEQNWKFVTVKNGKAKVRSGTHARKQASKNAMVQHFFTGATSPLKAIKGDKFFAYAYLDAANPPEQVMLQFNDGNWNHRVYWGANKIDWGSDKSPSRFYAGELPETGKWVRLEVNAEDVGFTKLSKINGMAFTQWGGKVFWDSAGIVSKTNQSSEFKSLTRWLEMVRQVKGDGLPGPIKKIVGKPEDKIDDAAKEKIRAYFLTNVNSESKNQFADQLKERDKLKKAFDDFNNGLPTTLISNENKEVKQAFMLTRGEYSMKADPVERNTPAALPPFSDELPKDRLGFAKWLTSGEHPLTARVAVNRFWQQVFGTGIVKTSEDFGAQGDTPSHPELLDWLATDFEENNWDVRRLMKMIVMSATYRQNSFVSKQQLERDPENRLLAHGPRFRLDAEMLRDQALSVSGLLVTTMGGPGVKPPQPDGLWFAVGYSGSNTVRFKKDEGPDKVHRRSLYTFWKRTAPPPQMNTFDAPSREECSVRRERTNTPLQALLLMNDPQYVEAARNLAGLTVEHVKQNSQSESDAKQNIRLAVSFMVERALLRPATEAEMKLLTQTYQLNLKEFVSETEAAKNLLEIGESPVESVDSQAELAAWTMIANLIMNMDEFVTKN